MTNFHSVEESGCTRLGSFPHFGFGTFSPHTLYYYHHTTLATGAIPYHCAVKFLLPSIALCPSAPSSNRYIGQSNRMVRLIHDGNLLYSAGGRGINNDTVSKYSL